MKPDSTFLGTPSAAKTRWLLLLLCGVLLQALVNPAHAENAKRVALLIGNASYSVGRLSNPPNDVREMESALKAVGFSVQTVLNANQNAMKRAVRDFGNLAQGADIAFLYYSGHGTQVNGENYLIPVQASIDKEADYEVEAVSANAVMRQIAGARPKAAIVVLDACRDNPLAATTRSTTKGLSRMDAPTGTMIAFATSPNTVATDEGVYARTLARQLRTPGLEIVDVFRNTTAEVRKATGGKQEPRISEMSITDRIYLLDAVAQRPPQPTQPVQVATLRPEPEPRPQPVAQPATAPPTVDFGIRMVSIPAGSFTMGGNQNENEKPAHRVTLKAFEMGMTEVTQGQWKAVMGSNPSRLKDCGDTCPVEKVSWNDVQDFIQKLNQKTGKRYRLPSEAEWEYAARAGTRTEYWWGDAIGNNNANCDGCGSRWDNKTTAPVGSFRPNAFGLYDMHGNVNEWVQDWYHDNYNGAPTDGSAWESGGEQKARVLRGGSWFISPAYLRLAYRNRYNPNIRESDYGFRLARTAP